MKQTLATLVVALGLFLVAPASVQAGGDWNDAGIQWMGYDEGLAKAKADKKPVCLIFFTQWCPHCTNYSKMFHDPKVVEKSKSFVMIRLDSDQNKDKSGMYKPDGEYIPRTFFLGSDGTLAADLGAPGRTNYKYFYNEADPASILGGMDAALAKLK